MGSACSTCGNDQAPQEIPLVKFYVTIVGAKGLFDDWHNQPLDFTRECFCTLQVGMDMHGATRSSDKDVHVTQSARNVVDPIWREEFGVPDLQDGGCLLFRVCASEGANREIRHLGKGSLAKHMFAANGFNGEVRLKDSTGAATKGCLTVRVRQASEPFYPLGQSVEDHMSIENKTKKALGLDVDAQDETTLYVMDVKAGVVRANNKVSPVTLTPGQFIVGVNNAAGSSAKLQHGLKQTQLELVIRRPVEFTILLEAGNKDDLGLEFTKKPLGNALLITKVDGDEGNGGATSAARIWNKSNLEQQVQQGDRVIAVNGFRGKSSEILKRLNALKGPRLQLTLIRPASLSCN